MRRPALPRPPCRVGRLGVLAALACALAACSGGEASSATPVAERTPAPAAARLVLTELPAGAESALLPDPGRRYPGGARVVVRDLAPPHALRATVSEGFEAAGGPSLSPDGSRVLFVARKAPGAPFTVHAARLDGSERWEIVPSATDCQGAAFLPDGRIVYAAAVPGTGPLDGRGVASYALFVADGDGQPGRRITFSAGLDVDPALLPDGRVAYATWVPADGGRVTLFAVHPDGTGATRLLAGGGAPAEAWRPAALDRATLAFVASDGAALALDLGAPGAPPRSLGERASAVAWAPEGAFLLAGASGARRILANGKAEVLAPGSDGAAVLEARLDVPPPRPQGHLSLVKPEVGHGTLLAIDARPPGEGRALRARLSRLEGPFAEGTSPRAVVLGETALRADGSFFARVPADVPLRLDLVDADGRLVAGGTTPFWVRPNETRGCVGCHEDAATTPPNRRPEAVLQDAVDLLGRPQGPEGTR